MKIERLFETTFEGLVDELIEIAAERKRQEDISPTNSINSIPSMYVALKEIDDLSANHNKINCERAIKNILPPLTPITRYIVIKYGEYHLVDEKELSEEDFAFDVLRVTFSEVFVVERCTV